MSLSDIHSRVRRAVGKGTSVDTTIVDEVRAAARWVERNHTFAYMKRYGTTSFDLDATYPYIIPVPHKHFKAIKLVRIVDSEGDFWPVVPTENIFQTSLGEGMPASYWIEGAAQMVFDKTPSEAWEVQFFFDQFTSWPTDDDAENWLILNGEDFLFHQAMLGMSVHLRDPRMRELFTSSRDESLRTLLLLDEEVQFSGGTGQMEFTPEGGIEWSAPSASS